MFILAVSVCAIFLILTGNSKYKFVNKIENNHKLCMNFSLTLKESIESVKTDIIQNNENVLEVLQNSEQEDDYEENMFEQSDLNRELINSIVLEPKYPDNKQLKEVLDVLMPQITKDCKDTYDKVKACYTYLIESCSYSTTVKYDYEYDAYLLLTEMKGSCTYYAAAFHYMMLYIGLDDEIISSYRKLGSRENFHRWNEIMISGEKYIFDTQWEDTISRSDNIQYKHFFKTYTEMQELYVLE